MTKIAVPIWNDRVSPVFDVATALLVAEFDGIRVEKRSIVVLLTPTDLGAQLEGLGIHILLCGGISTALLRNVAGRGIQVLRHICGPADTALQGFAEDRLQEDQFQMPGCHCKRHACRCRYRSSE